MWSTIGALALPGEVRGGMDELHREYDGYLRAIAELLPVLGPIAASSARGTVAGERFTSSASTRLANNGPRRTVKRPS